jgi:hypothetical protein
VSFSQLSGATCFVSSGIFSFQDLLLLVFLRPSGAVCVDLSGVATFLVSNGLICSKQAAPVPLKLVALLMLSFYFQLEGDELDEWFEEDLE